MLGVESKTVRHTWSVVVTLAAVAFLYYARQAILIFILAIFFAYMMAPVVGLLDRFHQGRLSRSISLTVVYVALLALIVAVVAAVASRASEEAANLIGKMPELAKSAGQLSKAPLPYWLEPFRGQLLDLLQQQVQGGLERFLPMLRATLGAVLSAIGNIGFVILVPILSFFFLKDAAECRQWILDTAARVNRLEFTEGLLNDIHAMLGQYIRALVLLSAATFVAYEVFFAIAGVPYQSLLATIAALLEFIPVVGPLTAAIVACVVALISGYTHVLWMVVFFLAYRMFQDYVLQPMLYSAGIELHPLLVMFGALAGEEVGGIFGMVLSVPVLAALRLLWNRVVWGKVELAREIAPAIALLAAALPLNAHVISMSSSEFRVSGNRATFELRMPLYEVQHVTTPEKTLFEQLEFKSNGAAGKVVERSCREEKEDGAFRCRAVYEWAAPVEEVDAYCGFHKVTVPNHIHLLHAFREDKSDQAVFDFSNTQRLIRFRPPTAFETWVTAMGSGFARVFASAASVLFLVCLAMAARSRRELLWMTAAFLAGEVLSAAIVSRSSWSPAPRFVEAALALTVAYLAVEILALPAAGQRWMVAGALGAFHGLSFAVYLTATGYGDAPVLSGMALADLLSVGLIAFVLERMGRVFTGLAPAALRVSASLLLVTGLGWFFLRLRS